MRIKRCINILNINTGTDNPAPGFETLDVGELRRQVIFVVALLPDIVDKSATLPFSYLDHFNKELLTVRVFKIGNILTFEFLDKRMHDHPRLKVIDPEVAVVTVAHPLDRLNSQLASLGVEHLTGLG